MITLSRCTGVLIFDDAVDMVPSLRAGHSTGAHSHDDILYTVLRLLYYDFEARQLMQ